MILESYSPDTQLNCPTISRGNGVAVTSGVQLVPALVLTCRVLIVFSGLRWWYLGDVLQLTVALSCLVVTILPGLLARHLILRDAAEAVTTVLLAAHVVFGIQLGLYETSAVYDKAMHFLGSGAIAGLLAYAICTYCIRYSIDLPPTIISVTVFGGTVSAGALWEIFEFAMDRTGFFNAQRGLQDTMLDLIADAAGGCVMVAMLIVAKLVSSKSIIH